MNLTQKAAVKRLFDLCELKNASFSLPHHSIDMAEQDTALIKEATRLYRETWILPVLSELLNEGGSAHDLSVLTK